ncbi:MAG: DUF4375 domain-containing protein [Clostridia bacterium]|nr:DUF4375 domain-containing protein [Clostridia bacterium]
MDFYNNDALYLQMSTDELSLLSDEELFYAIMVRTEHKVDDVDEWEEGVNALNFYQKVFYSVNWLEIEVNNGGLCQFFVNSSRMVAPLVSEYMAIIGAIDHKTLYDAFVEKNEIDLRDLSSFDIDTVEEFEAQYERYPFADYDDAFYELEPLETYLTKYARENLANF